MNTRRFSRLCMEWRQYTIFIFNVNLFIQVVCHISCLILTPIMLYVAFQARPLHRNVCDSRFFCKKHDIQIRISFANAILRISFGATSRLILLHYQYFGTTSITISEFYNIQNKYSLDMALVTFASCLREAFLNFYNGA